MQDHVNKYISSQLTCRELIFSPSPFICKFCLIKWKTTNRCNKAGVLSAVVRIIRPLWANTIQPYSLENTKAKGLQNRYISHKRRWAIWSLKIIKQHVNWCCYCAAIKKIFSVKLKCTARQSENNLIPPGAKSGQQRDGNDTDTLL